MKTICIFKSEMDDSLYACDEIHLDKFNKVQNKEITISPHLIIRPWELVCRVEFLRKQPATEFEDLLNSKAGIDFANRYLLLNPIAELRKLICVLPKKCQFYVMGGLALDGHRGVLTRRHDDLDLICWRKDIGILKKALKQIGYTIREKYTEGHPRLLRLIETDEEYPAIEVKVIDEQPNNCFRFYVNGPGKNTFPIKLLGPKRVSLEGIRFPAISLQLISELNEINRQNLKQTKKENPKLYNLLKYKISKIQKDKKLIYELMNNVPGAKGHA